MKKTVNHILVAGLLALLSLASCTDEFIEGNYLQGVDRDKRVEVRLPFGVGRGITTTITSLHPYSSFVANFEVFGKMYGEKDALHEINKELFLEKMKEWGVEVEGLPKEE